MNTDAVKEISETVVSNEIFYQFLDLYDRWSEDRQAALQLHEDNKALVKVFSEEIRHFEKLESYVREHIRSSIQQASAEVAKTVAIEMNKEAARASVHVATELSKAANKAKDTLDNCRQEIASSKWRMFGLPIISGAVTALLLVWILMPRATLPLSDEQIRYMKKGMLMEMVWPKLSGPEQRHWTELERQVDKG